MGLSFSLLNLLVSFSAGKWAQLHTGLTRPILHIENIVKFLGIHFDDSDWVVNEMVIEAVLIGCRRQLGDQKCDVRNMGAAKLEHQDRNEEERPSEREAGGTTLSVTSLD